MDRASTASQAIAPSARTTRARGSKSSSRSRKGAQRVSSSRAGLFSGGAQRPAVRMKTSRGGELETVVARHARGLARSAGAVEGRVEEVARPVAREDPPRPVCPVSARGESPTRKSQARSWIAESRNGLSPVVGPAETSDLLRRHALAPGDQARAGAAAGDLVVQRRERRALRSGRVARGILEPGAYS